MTLIQKVQALVAELTTLSALTVQVQGELTALSAFLDAV
jgi:hypothetical protein